MQKTCAQLSDRNITIMAAVQPNAGMPQPGGPQGQAQSHPLLGMSKEQVMAMHKVGHWHDIIIFSQLCVNKDPHH